MIITRNQIKKNPEVLFIFGDNDKRTGYGGMAKEFRGEPNCLGIRTKKQPSTSEDSYYSDIEYKENCDKILEDINKIIEESKKYIAVYIPENIGDGLSMLEQKAPNTYIFLKEQIQILSEKLIKRNN